MPTPDWSEGLQEWEDILEQVRRARANVGTTYAGSWFRGQTSNWPLVPSLYRATSKIESEITKLRACKAERAKELKGALRFARKRGVDSDERIKEIKFLIQRLEERIAQNAKRLPDRRTGAVHGEGRAFVEYRFRSGVHHQSSWQTLAEMQHYQIPTRLLDWSESFVFALALSLANYVRAMQQNWSIERANDLAFAADRHLTFHRPESLFPDSTPEEPVLWILNPYRLSEQATGEPLLWDFMLREQDDYYRAFIADRQNATIAKFEKPVTILTPWRDERIAAQKGVFTCFGSKVEALEDMVGQRILQRVQLPPKAAVHGVRFLHEVGGIDEFTMFRDRDSLGKKASREFFPEFNANHNGV